MTSNSRPPRILELLVNWLTPQSSKEDLLGDLEEDYHRLHELGHTSAKVYYLSNVLRLIPFLALGRLEEMKNRSALFQFAATVLFLSFSIIWDLALVQKQAWPLTARFMDNSFIPATGLYFSIYSGLYILGIAAIFRLNRSRNQFYRYHYINPCILAAVLMIMPIISAIYPQPLDSYWMRGLQILMIWIFAMISVIKGNNTMVKSAKKFGDS